MTTEEIKSLPTPLTDKAVEEMFYHPVTNEEANFIEHSRSLEQQLEAMKRVAKEAIRNWTDLKELIQSEDVRIQSKDLVHDVLVGAVMQSVDKNIADYTSTLAAIEGMK